MRPALPLASALLFVTVLGLGLGAAGATSTANAEDVALYAATVGLDDADAVESAIANGTADPADEVVAGETLVVAIDSERLASDLDSRNGTTTDRFLDAVAGDADLRIDQTNPGPQRTRKVVRLGRENATAYRTGVTTYVLVETDAVEYRRYRPGENDPADLRDGDRFAVTFGYDLDDHEIAGPEFDLYATEAEFSQFDSYDPLAPEVVNRSVKVNVDPEDAVVARMTLDGGRTLTDAAGPVDWSGWPGVSLDLRGVEPGTGYALELVHDGEVVDRYNGTVREPDATVHDAEVTEVEGYTAVNATAELSHGGAVRVLDEEGTELGSAPVDPDTKTDLTVRLRGEATGELRVRAAREEHASAEYYDGPESEATVEFGDREVRTPTPTVSATPEPTATTTSVSPDETSTSHSPDETATSASPDATSTSASPGVERVPGFGPVAGLVAVVALVLAALRRA